MSPPRSDLDVIETLARRRPLLERLVEGSATKPVLVDDLDCSRSTVDRAIRELESLEFVTRQNGTYRITTAGRLAIDRYRDCVGALESLTGATDPLSYVPADAPMSIAMLEGASTWTPQPHAPNETFEEIESLLAVADRIHGLAAAERIPTLRERLYERCTAGALEADLVFTDDLASFVISAYPDMMDELLSGDAFRVAVRESIPYELVLLETPTRSEAFVFVLNDAAEIRGVIRNDAEGALAWAHDTYRRFRATATPLRPDSG